MKIHQGDCREILKVLTNESVDSVVCDPPYELGFMGKKWDSTGIAYDPTLWVECLRVLKPGGHLLAFGGSRTYHRLACAIEDAGFVIRDQIMWIYGSGFPKSRNIGKAIDKRRDDSLLHVTSWLNAQIKRTGITYAKILSHFRFNEGSGQVGHWTALSEGAQPSIPSWDQWGQLKSLLKFGDEMDSEVARLNGRKGEFGDDWKSAKITGEYQGDPGGFGKHRFSMRDNKKRELTDAAKQWDGWGTALKPAHEPIVLARKPFKGPVEKNVLEYGTGAINVGGCKVPSEKQTGWGGKAAGGNTWNKENSGLCKDGEARPVQGRWPANLIHDGSEEVEAEFAKADGKESPSRFFYCAKSSKAERNAGLEGEERQEIGGGGTGNFEAARKYGSIKGKHVNHHPTVKPVALMRYLCRLVTPPGGTVLDPFAGSGSTGVAAKLEGFEFIGIEKKLEYADIAERRINAS